MTEFKMHVKEVLHAEIVKEIKENGFFLETEFCNRISRKYNFSIHTTRPILRDVYLEFGLVQRRASDELKEFYHLKIAGHPIIYMLNTHTGN